MTPRTTPPTLADPATLPPVVDLVTAAGWLGIGRTTAYRLAANGTFPVPVLRIGNCLRVPTAPLLRLLDVELTATPRGDEVLEGSTTQEDDSAAGANSRNEMAPATEPPDRGEEPHRRPLRRAPRWSVDRARTR